MQRVLFALLLLFSVVVVSAQRVDFTVQLEGRNREFIAVAPSGPAPVDGFPIVFMLHGTSGDGLKFYNISGWKELVESKKFIAVFPSSLRWCVIDDEGVSGQHTTTKWVNGDLLSVACEGQTLVDDVNFFRKMVDTIRSFISVDTNRIFASGFSNGGVMTSKLAMEASDLFAAIAVSSGPMMDSTTPQRNIPVWFSIGSLDDRLLSAAGVSEIPNNDSCLKYLFPIINRFLGAFRLTQEYSREETPLTITYTFRTPLTGAPPALFLATLVKGLEHSYPNGENYPLSAASVFWEFFMASTATTDVHETESAVDVMTLSPNPANNSIRLEFVEGTKVASVRIYNAIGAEVLVIPVDRNVIRLDVNDFPPGVYYVRAGTQTLPLTISR